MAPCAPTRCSTTSRCSCAASVRRTPASTRSRTPGAATWRSCSTACVRGPTARRCPTERRRHMVSGMSAPEATDPQLDAIAWNLSDLLDGADDPAAAVESMLDESQRRADAFGEAHAGKIADLDGPGLVAAMHELADLQDLLGRAGSYAVLSFSENTADPARGALMQRMQEKATAIETLLVFFELEWAALSDERAEELLASDGLDFARHHLETARRYRPHLLSEPEEKILAEKGLTGRSAWTRLFEEQASAITVDLGEGGEPVSLELALSRLFAPDRELRRRTAEQVTAALQPGLRVRGYVLNTLIADKSVDDRL